MRDFVRWCDTASVGERCRGAEMLADALLDPGCGEGERRHCLDALLHLAADASPKVRLALAARFVREARAPRMLVRILCTDTDAIAVPLVAASGVLLDDDLVDLAATGTVRLRCAIARRAKVSAAVCAAVLVHGERVVAIELLGNAMAAIAASTLRMLAEGTEGTDATVRDLLLRREDLPADIRHTLMLRTGEALSQMGLAVHLLGEATARRIVTEACEQATPIVAEGVSGARLGSFVGHLRASGQITAAFLVRVACDGQFELFANALSNLSGLDARRVRAIVVEAREPAFSALCTAARVPAETIPLLAAAIGLWKEIVQDGRAVDGNAGAFVVETLAARVREKRLAVSPQVHSLLVRLSAQATGRMARLAA